MINGIPYLRTKRGLNTRENLTSAKGGNDKLVRIEKQKQIVFNTCTIGIDRAIEQKNARLLAREAKRKK